MTKYGCSPFLFQIPKFPTFGAQNPQILNISKFLDFPIFHFVIRFQRALNHYSSIIVCSDMTEKAFYQKGPKCPTKQKFL